MIFLTYFFISVFSYLTPIEDRKYVPKGIGAGGAMSSFGISPFDSDLWFVSTDMGTLFRSYDSGRYWQAIDHDEFAPGSDLSRATKTSFCSNVNTVLVANQGEDPKRSTDTGKTYSDLTNLAGQLDDSELIKYWTGNPYDSTSCLCVTNQRVLYSTDEGVTYTPSTGFSDEPGVGTYINGNTVIHATSTGLYESSDGGQSFTSITSPVSNILSFAGGSSGGSTTLALLDDDASNACSMYDPVPSVCGYVWVKQGSGDWTKTSQYGGDHLKMALNDDQTIYVTGYKEDWPEGKGTSVFRSQDAGDNWDLVFLQLDWDVVPFERWADLTPSAVGLDVGWWDDGYESFDICPTDSNVLGGTGWFFLHTSSDGADWWDSPTSEYADVEPIEAGKYWRSIGLEVTSFYLMMFHPLNTSVGFAGIADVGGMVTTDGGDTFKFSRVGYNSQYDYAYDPTDENIWYAATSTHHDWPYMWYSQVLLGSEGGIYKTTDMGGSWDRLTRDDNDELIGYLSVIYDHDRNTIYAGTHGRGVLRSTNGGTSWEFFNSGIPAGDGMIIPRLQLMSNGDVYALLTGDDPSFTNRGSTGVYYLQQGTTTWTLLRGNVHYPPEGNPDDGYELWWYPTSFVVDPDDTDVIFVTDMEKQGTWLVSGVWKSTDRGQNFNRTLQFTHPTNIYLFDGQEMAVTGSYEMGGTWGNGGLYRSEDYGETWTKDTSSFLRHNHYAVTKDPNRVDNEFHSFFGGGMLCGENCGYTTWPPFTPPDDDNDDDGDSDLTEDIGFSSIVCSLIVFVLLIFAV